MYHSPGWAIHSGLLSTPYVCVSSTSTSHSRPVGGGGGAGALGTGVGVTTMTTGVEVSTGAGTGVEVGATTAPATNVEALAVLLVRSGSTTRADGSTIAETLMTLPGGAVTTTEKVNPTDPPGVRG